METQVLTMSMCLNPEAEVNKSIVLAGYGGHCDALIFAGSGNEPVGE